MLFTRKTFWSVGVFAPQMERHIAPQTEKSRSVRFRLSYCLKLMLCAWSTGLLCALKLKRILFFFVHEFRIFKILYPIFPSFPLLMEIKRLYVRIDPIQLKSTYLKLFFLIQRPFYVLLSLKPFWPLSKECFNNFEQEKVTAHGISNNRKFGLHCRWISVVHFMRWKHLWSHFSSWMLLVIRIVSFERGKKVFTLICCQTLHHRHQQQNGKNTLRWILDEMLYE